MADRVHALHRAGLVSELDVQVALGLGRMVGEARGEALLALALASRATRAGHVCLDLASAATWATDEAGTPHAELPSLAAWQEVLAASPLARGASPLVLERSRVYLRRYWEHERQLAARLAVRVSALEPDVDGPLLRAGLARLFGPGGAPDLQRRAAVVASLRRFCILSGGPGTGKTTTVTKILALLQEQALARRGRPLEVALVAPTGKAAARLRESIEAWRAKLEVTEAVRAAIPTEATTIHRRLGTVPGTVTRFRHGEENPLACEVMIVDEASMIDLPLMARLVAALPATAKLILLGDRHQLASVEVGAILGDLCLAAGPRVSDAFASHAARVAGEALTGGGEGGLADCVVHLEKSYRYAEAPGIRALAEAIHAGDGEEAVRVLRERDLPDVTLAAGAAERSLGPDLRASVVAGYRAFACARETDEVARGLEAYRVLCAHRRGPAGVGTLNAQIEAALVGEGLVRGPGGSPWYDHRPVMVVENDYAVGLFNGDIGVALRSREAGALRVVFGGAPPRELAPSRLPRHETVFATTVHKSQGSEVEEVALVLPEASSRVLTRELGHARQACGPRVRRRGRPPRRRPSRGRARERATGAARGRSRSVERPEHEPRIGVGLARLRAVGFGDHARHVRHLRGEPRELHVDVRVPPAVLVLLADPAEDGALREDVAHVLALERATREVPEQHVERLALEDVLRHERRAVVAGGGVVAEEEDLAVVVGEDRRARGSAEIDAHVDVAPRRGGRHRGARVSGEEVGRVHPRPLLVVPADGEVRPLAVRVVAAREVGDLDRGGILRQDDDGVEAGTPLGLGDGGGLRRRRRRRAGREGGEHERGGGRGAREHPGPDARSPSGRQALRLVQRPLLARSAERVRT